MKLVLSLFALLAFALVADAQCGPGGCSPSGARSMQWTQSAPTYSLPTVTYDAVKPKPTVLFSNGWYEHESGFLERYVAGICTKVVFPADPEYRAQKAAFDAAVREKLTAKAKVDCPLKGSDCDCGCTEGGKCTCIATTGIKAASLKEKFPESDPDMAMYSDPQGNLYWLNRDAVELAKASNGTVKPANKYQLVQVK